jgi:2'-5' RNA ligase
VSNLVIVAIPDENDHVWKVSSEKVPHLTVLFLGDVDQISNLETVVQFVEHAANTTLNRFYLPVDRRGELGADKADVLFFKKGRYDYKAIRDFRVSLLQNNNIKTAYDSAQQFEGPWNPHLTLGYPEDPAKEEDPEFGFYSVYFNKIAVWTGDFEGPEFLLTDEWDEFEALETVPMDVAMSNMNQTRVDAGLRALTHYGIKGMHWGQRKAREVSTQSHVDSGVFKRRTEVRSTGGEAHDAHPDAVMAAVQKQKLKKSGTNALSTQELRELANRLQVENQVSILMSSKGKQFVSKQLEQEGKAALRKGTQKAAPHVIRRASKGAATVATTAALL